MTSATENTIEIDLKSPWKAALWGFLIPGAGHFYQGRVGKGVLFAACILTTFFYGLYLGGGRVVYASTTKPIANPGKFIDRWQFACQAPVGFAAIPAYMQAWRVETGSKPLFGDRFLRPAYTADDIDRLFASNAEQRRQAQIDHLTTQLDTKNDAGERQVVYHPNEAAKWQYDYGFFFELGTIYTVIAGLLNVLAIYDAHSGPVLPEEAKGEPAKES
jgi:hypothetical protein